MTSAFFLLTSAPVRVMSSHESFQKGLKIETSIASVSACQYYQGCIEKLVT